MNQSASAFEKMPKYVRVRSAAHAHFVEFDFAIGHPELFVELVMPPKAFERFCRDNRVEYMDAHMCEALDADARKWRYGETRDVE